jgi:hypothetical protein
MLTRIMKQAFMPVLLLALLWPTPAGYYVRLGVAACVAAIWDLQANRSKYLRQTAYRAAPPKEKYEN